MSEKKIQRGYYRLESRLSGSKSDIVRVHGMTQEGLVICETAEGHVYRIPDKRNGWYHLLHCTGFDWVATPTEDTAYLLAEVAKLKEQLSKTQQRVDRLERDDRLQRSMAAM
jgi:hypothetical protein